MRRVASVVESLARQGFHVYLTDWIPPASSDGARGLDAHVNEDLLNTVHVIAAERETSHVWLSLVRCAASNRRTHGGFRAFFCKISEIGDSLAERVGAMHPGRFRSFSGHR
jgi:hypothetical protein